MVLVRRKVLIEPKTPEEFQKVVQNAEISSFWGHENTLSVVKQLLGVDLTPKEERPILSLSEDNFPQLYGESFTEVWLVNPDYKGVYRSKIGEEVSSDKIAGWQILKVTYL